MPDWMPFCNSHKPKLRNSRLVLRKLRGPNTVIWHIAIIVRGTIRGTEVLSAMMILTLNPRLGMTVGLVVENRMLMSRP